MDAPISELTGTRAWGLSTEKSDWDYITLAQDVEIWREVAKYYNIEENTWNRGFSYINDEGKKINIISLSISEFKAWSLATKLMGLLPKEKLKDRANRIATFKLLQGVAYLHIDVTTSSSSEENKK